jgi:hypothetical protein
MSKIKELMLIGIKIEINIRYKRKNLDITYSIKEYSSLILTVFKCIEQFINEYSPEGLYIEGEDSFTKQDIGKKGQKNAIYKYALQNVDIPPNYILLTNESGGVQILKK